MRRSPWSGSRGTPGPLRSGIRTRSSFIGWGGGGGSAPPGGGRGALAVSLLGFIALAVACLGVVGLVAYSVAQHTKEIGIRLALGAESSHILRSLSRQFRGTIIGGLLLGVLGAAGLAQLLRRGVYGPGTRGTAA